VYFVGFYEIKIHT